MTAVTICNDFETQEYKVCHCFHCFLIYLPWSDRTRCNLKNDRIISVRFQGKPFNTTVIQVYAPTSTTEEAEVEWFYEDLQDLLELTPPKDDLFIIGDWNGKEGNQETAT